MDWCRNIGGCSNAAAFQAAWVSISSDPSAAIIRYPRSGQQAGHGAGSAGQVQHRLHREGASVELPRQVVCPPAVFHIHCQGIVAGGQGVITAHLSRFLYRAKIFS